MRASETLDVEGLHIQEGISDRQHQSLPSQHLRTLLVPKRQVLRDRLILVDPRPDLHGAENQLLFGKLQDD